MFFIVVCFSPLGLRTASTSWLHPKVPVFSFVVLRDFSIALRAARAHRPSSMLIARTLKSWGALVPAVELA